MVHKTELKCEAPFSPTSSTIALLRTATYGLMPNAELVFTWRTATRLVTTRPENRSANVCAYIVSAVSDNLIRR